MSKFLSRHLLRLLRLDVLKYDFGLYPCIWGNKDFFTTSLKQKLEDRKLKSDQVEIDNLLL